MIDFVSRIFRRILRAFGRTLIKTEDLTGLLSRRETYAQYGEDLIIQVCLGHMGIDKGVYVDIGANHPFELSNSALLHLHGWHGVNVEPDPEMYALLSRCRPFDINLNLGVANVTGEMTYFEFKNNVFNSFSEREANLLTAKGEKLVRSRPVAVQTFNDIVEVYLNGVKPTLLLLDAEGLDEEIIRSIDYRRYGPLLIFVETFAYGTGQKNTEIVKFLGSVGYSVLADTFVNTLFMRNTENIPV